MGSSLLGSTEPQAHEVLEEKGRVQVLLQHAEKGHVVLVAVPVGLWVRGVGWSGWVGKESIAVEVWGTPLAGHVLRHACFLNDTHTPPAPHAHAGHAAGSRAFFSSFLCRWWWWRCRPFVLGCRSLCLEISLTLPREGA